MIKSDPRQNPKSEHRASMTRQVNVVTSSGQLDAPPDFMDGNDQVQRESTIRRAHRLRMREYFSRLNQAS